MKVLIAGASGLIGTALSRYLAERGDDVVRLVRDPPRSVGERQWAPQSRTLDPEILIGMDAVVSLNGAGVGDKRWTAAYRELILSSRLDATSALAGALAQVDRPIRWVSASAVGYYGDRGDEVLTETSPKGDGFLSDVVARWEAATEAAAQASEVSVALARTGIVLSPTGGAMTPLLKFASIGLAGPFGRGEMYWPWISLVDEVAALVFLIDHPGIDGPVNLCGPTPVRQRELVSAVGQAMHRPTVLPAPRLALRAALGGFADEVLASQRVVPQVLLDRGFAFRHATVEAAVNWVVNPS